mmetsp:Transcript_40993/g.131068  ORF Transcript_40993/g.131068 Transcript_40993/m.131068 type:complete len:233 (+) Transcript_40993:432-1130(+)
MALSASSSAASLPSAHAASRPGAAAGPPLGRRRWQSPALAMSWSSRSPPALRAARGAHTTTGLPSRAAATSLPGFVSHHDAPRCGEVHRGSESPATWRCCRKPLFESCCSGAIHRPSSALLSATDPRPSLPFHSMPVVVWPLRGCGDSGLALGGERAGAFLGGLHCDGPPSPQQQGGRVGGKCSCRGEARGLQGGHRRRRSAGRAPDFHAFGGPPHDFVACSTEDGWGAGTL